MASSQAPLAAVLILALLASLAAMEGADAICDMSNADFKLCQPAAATSNPTESPSPECCAALGHADLACICRYKGVAGIWLRMYHIDPTRAMALPRKCGLAMPANCS